MDGAISEGVCEGGVDEAMLLDQRASVERVALDGHVEVVAAAGAVDDVERFGVRKRFLEE